MNKINCKNYKTYLVALTGGIGAGKTTIANIFSTFNVPIIDSDVIAKKIVRPGSDALQKIQYHFGSKILSHDGTLNRRLLRDKIFSDNSARLWLNQLLHPLICHELHLELCHIQSAYTICVIPLLFENQHQYIVDRILVIDIPEKQQIARIVARDKINIESAQHILLAQASREERAHYAHDIIINNEGTTHENLLLTVKKHHYLYLSLAHYKNFDKKLR